METESKHGLGAVPPKQTRTCDAEEASFEFEDAAEPQDESQRIEVGGNKNEITDDTASNEVLDALETQLNAAKFFIVKSFDSQRVGRDEASSMLDRLEGTRWNSDHDILAAAVSCDLDPQRLVARTDLITNRSFLVKAFKRSSDYYSKELWEVLDEATREDTRVAFAALSRGLTLSKLPDSVQKMRSTLLDELKGKRFRWQQLSDDYKRDVDFALAACDDPDTYFHDVVTTVTDKEKLWLEWACRYPERTRVGDWKPEDVPAFVTTDAAVMSKVIQVFPLTARIVDNSLAENKDFVLSLLKSTPISLDCFPKTTYTQCPDIVSEQALNDYIKAGGSHHSLRHALPSKFWADRQFVREWAFSGGGIDIGGIPKSTFGDKDVFRAVAGSSLSHKEMSFFYMSKDLRSDKDFVLELCEMIDARHFISYVSWSLKFDEEVLMAACARSANDVFPPGYFSKYSHFVSQVEAKMRTFEGFFKGVLCGVMLDSGASIALLNQGPDAGILRNIASYLDFPVGKQLGHLIKAAKNLRVDGFHPYDAPD